MDAEDATLASVLNFDGFYFKALGRWQFWGERGKLHASHTLAVHPSVVDPMWLVVSADKAFSLSPLLPEPRSAMGGRYDCRLSGERLASYCLPPSPHDGDYI